MSLLSNLMYLVSFFKLEINWLGDLCSTDDANNFTGYKCLVMLLLYF